MITISRLVLMERNLLALDILEEGRDEVIRESSGLLPLLLGITSNIESSIEYAMDNSLSGNNARIHIIQQAKKYANNLMRSRCESYEFEML